MTGMKEDYLNKEAIPEEGDITKMASLKKYIR